MGKRRLKERKLKRTQSHRKALLVNLATALLRSGRIHTTEPKAKELRRFVDGIISDAKKGGLSSIRKVNALIRDGAILKKIFGEIVEAVKERQSGFTRIIKTGHRQGDGARMVIIELVDSIKEKAEKAEKTEKAEKESVKQKEKAKRK